MEILTIIILLCILYYYHIQIKELKHNLKGLFKAHNEYIDYVSEKIKKIEDKIKNLD